MPAFNVKVPNFEGPLDLLLFFIKRDELDIYDIPIAYITQEFLRYLHLVQKLDLELAGEFIVMASILMQIKARMLLPSMQNEDEDEVVVDPRAELTQRLLEYKRFKETAEEMESMEREQKLRYFRSLFKFDVRLKDPEENEQVLRDVTVYHLIAAFQHAMEKMPQKTVHEVRRIPYSIEEQGSFLLDRLERSGAFRFLDIVEEMQDKLHLVVTFIALLELIRAHRIRVDIQGPFNDFLLLPFEDRPVVSEWDEQPMTPTSPSSDAPTEKTEIGIAESEDGSSDSLHSASPSFHATDTVSPSLSTQTPDVA